MRPLLDRSLRAALPLAFLVCACAGGDDTPTGTPAGQTTPPATSGTPTPTATATATQRPPTPTPTAPSPTDGTQTSTEQPSPTLAPSPTPEPPNVFPDAGAFVDAPVGGLRYTCDTLAGVTGADGAFEFFQGELIDFSIGSLWLGTAVAQRSVTVLDLLPGKDFDDVEVANLARLLQSLDQDGDAANGILITSEVALAVDTALAALDLTGVDFSAAAQVQDVIDQVLLQALDLPDHALREVDAEEARAALMVGLDAADLLRVNVTRTPWQATRKPKLDIMTVTVTGRASDGIETGERVKPIVVTYSDQVEDTGASDIFVAVSLDDGRSWRRTNVSQSADRTSFTRSDGIESPGDATRPQVRVDGGLMVVTWPSRYCPDPNPGDLTVSQDVYGVAGPQLSKDYALSGEAPELGEVPFSCTWAARGWIDDAGVHWLRAEQISSGVRDAIQNMVGGSPQVGYALTWQEDPSGLKLGAGEAWGAGGTGATVNDGTDIWYSFLRWGDFKAVDGSYVPGDDPDAQYDDGVARPRAAVAFSAPVRVTDNAPCRYQDATLIEGEPYCADLCASTLPADDGEGSWCVTGDGRVLDGKTGAARPNIALVAQSRSVDGSTVKSATVLLAYEEKKGDSGDEEESKLVVYHNFAWFDEPETLAAGALLSEPSLSGRRVRFAAVGSANAGASDTRVALIYREGPDDAGCTADIMLRRAVGGYTADRFGPAVNLSSPTVTATAEGPGGTEATAWQWTESDLAHRGDHNPYDDARGLRLQLRGDMVAVGWAWTPNWALAEVGLDHHDFYLRRSFDGGATWTDASGVYEPPRNLSNLRSNDVSVIEPRLVFTPQTITNADGSPTGDPADVLDPNTFFVAYGTAFNTECDDEAEDSKRSADLFFSRTTDRGETYDVVEAVDPKTGDRYETWEGIIQGTEAQDEAQLKMSPDGRTLYLGWGQTLESETEPQSDVWMRWVRY